MEYKVEKSDGKVIVYLKGKMYTEDAGELRDKALECIKDGYKDFILDMEGLEYIDSTGLGVIVAIHKRCIQNGGEITIRNLRGAVKDIFEWTRMNRVFNIE